MFSLTGCFLWACPVHQNLPYLPRDIRRPKAVVRVFLVATLMVCCGLEVQSTVARRASRELSLGSRALNEPQEPTAKSAGALRIGESLTQQIKGGEAQTFAISLAAGQYAEISIEQHGSILLATLSDPQGKEVVQMDTPSGGHGPIYFSTIGLLTGDYRLEIRSINKWANAASYDVVITSLRSAELTDQSQVAAHLSFSEGRKSFRANKAAAAVDFYNRALAYWHSTQNYHWQALTEYALSEAYRNLGNRQKWEESLNETLRILQIKMAPNDWRLKASVLNDLGTIYYAGGQNEKAFTMLNEALNLYAANNDRRGQASALGNLGRLHGRLGDLSSAREFVDRALVLRRAENDKPGEINLLNSLGGISDQLGEPERALDYFAQALQGWEQLGETRPDDSKSIAAVLSNLATESDKLGKWNQALDYYDRALAKYEDDPNRAATLDSKGELYSSLGDPAKARECYDEALRLLATASKPDLDVKAGLLVHMGQLSLMEGNLAMALRDFEQARDLQPNLPKLADVLTNLGAALALQGKLEKAMEAYRSASEIQVKLRDQRGQALTLQKRGEARALMGEKAEALEDLRRALVCWKAVKDQRGTAATLNRIARVEQDRGNLAAAQADSKEAISIIESLRTNISNRQLRTSYFSTRENYYEFYIDLKMQVSKTEKGSESIASAFESSEKARARILLEALSEARVGRPEINKDSDVRLATMIRRQDALSEKLGVKAWARTKLLNRAPSPVQVVSIDRDINEITAEYDELEAQIRSLSPRFAALIRPQPSTLKEIQEQLDDNTLLLEYSLGDRRSFVWVVTPDSIKGFELPGRQEIEATAQRVVRSVTERNREEKNETGPQRTARFDRAQADYEEASSFLSKMVLDPVAPFLGQKRLVVVADGALQLVPFGALPAPKSVNPTEGATAKANTLKDSPARNDSRLLIEDHEIVYEASASVLALQRHELQNRKPAPLSVAVLADPVFDENDERVTRTRKGRAVVGSTTRPTRPESNSPGASSASKGAGKTDLTRALEDIGGERVSRLLLSADEAQSIIRLAPKGEAKAALGFDASRATAMSPELAQYRIIHFATHGLVDFDHPELSGIILSMVDEKGQLQDGYLRLHEIYNLNLPADLVVLSACQTGIGKQIRGEGLIALTRGFMYAGAARVVASLWKVDDAATAELMGEFYKQMFTNHEKPAAALRAAQVKLSQKNRWRSPYYWAGFVLQGEWK